MPFDPPKQRNKEMESDPEALRHAEKVLSGEEPERVENPASFTDQAKGETLAPDSDRSGTGTRDR